MLTNTTTMPFKSIKRAAKAFKEDNQYQPSHNTSKRPVERLNSFKGHHTGNAWNKRDMGNY